MDKLDEAALRRRAIDPDENAAVTLADGQSWWIAKPRVRVAPAGTKLGYRVRTRIGNRFDATLSDLITAHDEALNAEPFRFAAVIKAQLAIAAYMLRVNYDLTDDQVAELIEFDVNAEDDPIRDAFREIMSGAGGPKPPTAGSDSA